MVVTRSTKARSSGGRRKPRAARPRTAPTAAVAALKSSAAARRERQAATTRSEILEAALRAFGRLGFGATTMRDIAAEAGYTPGALYSYFESKDAIIVGIVGLLTAEFMRAYDEEPPAGTFAEKLEWLTRRQLGMVDQRRGAYTFLMALSANPDAVPKELRESHAKGGDGHLYCEKLGAWMATHGAPADLGGQDPLDLAYLLTGMGSAFFMRWLRDPTSGDLARWTPLILSTFFHGIQGSGRARRR